MRAGLRGAGQIFDRGARSVKLAIDRCENEAKGQFQWREMGNPVSGFGFVHYFDKPTCNFSLRCQDGAKSNQDSSGWPDVPLAERAQTEILCRRGEAQKRRRSDVFGYFGPKGGSGAILLLSQRMRNCEHSCTAPITHAPDSLSVCPRGAAIIAYAATSHLPVVGVMYGTRGARWQAGGLAELADAAGGDIDAWRDVEPPAEAKQC